MYIYVYMCIYECAHMFMCVYVMKEIAIKMEIER